VPGIPIRYQSADEDSSRWADFPFRPGDIVISTRSKCGTTWMQMICALLIFGDSVLPARLSTLSPWLDWLGSPRTQVFDRLAAQTHRRFIKTHTPLDGLPLDPHATYIVVGRHPLDMAVSLYHHVDNLNRERIAMLTGHDDPPPPRRTRPGLREWLLAWIDRDVAPGEQLDSLPGVLWHLSDTWARRAAPNVVLIHYDDLLADLDGEMRRLAERLGILLPAARWSALVEAASFDHMRGQADQLAPNPDGVLNSSSAFFRRGRSGAGREQLTDAELEHYRTRAARMVPSDLFAWLHRDSA